MTIPEQSIVDYTPWVNQPNPVRRQYNPPADFGIPNPYGPRVHNWKGGPLNEGSLFHGPNYTRPSYNLPFIKNSLFGVGENPPASEQSKMILFGVGFVCLATLAILLTPKRGY